MRLSEYLKQYNVTPLQFQVETGLSLAAISRYKNLKRIPDIPTLLLIKEATHGNVATFEDWDKRDITCQAT